MPRRPAPPAPERVDGFTVIKRLGWGGNAAVYLVESRGRHYALKQSRIRKSGRYSNFQKEFRTLSRLDVAGVVRVHQFGWPLEGGPYITMDRVPGISAKRWVHGAGTLGSVDQVARAVSLLHEVSAVLARLHQHALVHCDIKSTNILVTPDGKITLIDFGAVLQLPLLTEPRRRTKFLGTRSSAAPEQSNGAPIGHFSDMYSLGVLLYSMLVGNNPFRGEDSAESSHRHQTLVPPEPADVISSIPKEISDLTMRLLSKNPVDRPTTGDVLRHLTSRENSLHDIVLKSR